MIEYLERLNNLDNDKLIDVVKNYRQHGYDNKIREAAILILNERGIAKEQLQLNGKFENETYNYTKELYNSFRRNSKTAFILYSILIITNILVSFINTNSELIIAIALIINCSTLISYLFFLLKSFINQNQFYKTIDKDFEIEGALIYFFFGMPFYIFIYLYFKKQMKDKMKEIK